VASGSSRFEGRGGRTNKAGKEERKKGSCTAVPAISVSAEHAQEIAAPAWACSAILEDAK